MQIFWKRNFPILKRKENFENWTESFKNCEKKICKNSESEISNNLKRKKISKIVKRKFLKLWKETFGNCEKKFPKILKRKENLENRTKNISEIQKRKFRKLKKISKIFRKWNLENSENFKKKIFKRKILHQISKIKKFFREKNILRFTSKTLLRKK